MTVYMCVNCGTYYRKQMPICEAPLTDGMWCRSAAFEMKADVPASHLLPHAYNSGVK